MNVRYITTSDLPELARETWIDERERTISGPERRNLGAFRGFMFAMLIEGSLALAAVVGWQLWKLLA